MKNKIEDLATKRLASTVEAREKLAEIFESEDISTMDKAISEIQLNIVEQVILDIVIDLVTIAKDLDEDDFETNKPIINDFIREVIPGFNEEVEEVQEGGN